MGRPVSRQLFKILNSDDFEPVELLEVRLAGQATAAAMRFTSYGAAVTWNGYTWQPIDLRHSQVEEKMASSSGEVPSVTVTITNVDRQWGRILGEAEVEGAEAALYLTDRRMLSNARDAIELTRGEVRLPLPATPRTSRGRLGRSKGREQLMLLRKCLVPGLIVGLLAKRSFVGLAL